MLAYDFPILGLFWTMLIFFIWVAWIVLVFRVIGDVFRNGELSGVAKAAWIALVILVPWLGVLAYLLVNGQTMAGREIAREVEAREQLDAYVRETAGSGASTADEIAKLASLRESGALTDEEFAAQKAKLLA